MGTKKTSLNISTQPHLHLPRVPSPCDGLKIYILNTHFYKKCRSRQCLHFFEHLLKYSSVIFQKKLIVMKNILLVLLLTFSYNKANREHEKLIPNDEKKAIATLSEQLVIAMHDYISGCNIVPIEKSCYTSQRSMETIQSEISRKKKLVKILVWSKNLEIKESLSLSNYKSQELDKFKEIVLLVHDMGESSCSKRMKKLIRRSYKNKPDAAVLTLDYSSIVSGKIE